MNHPVPDVLIVVDALHLPPDPYSCEGLELFKPLPDGRVWAAVYKVVPREQSVAFQQGRIPEPSPESAISHQLGVLLEWAHFSYQSNNDSNPGVIGLFLDGNPDSPNLGTYTRKAPRGNIAVIRADEKPFDDGQMSCVSEYLMEEIGYNYAAAYRKARTKEDRERCKNALMRKLTPAAFHAYWVEFQRCIVAEDNAGKDKYLNSLRRHGHDPLKIKSPVETTLGEEVIPACGNCGSIFGEEGNHFWLVAAASSDDTAEPIARKRTGAQLVLDTTVEATKSYVVARK